jgi:uncharacterized surface protein with fasciclin (FAS1) repeats
VDRRNRQRRSRFVRGGLLAAGACLVAPLTGCTSSGDSASSAASTSRTTSSATASSSTAVDAGQPVGSGCAQLPATTLQAMGTVPVVAGAGSDPQLTSLVQAVTAASLVDTLNGTQNITVFAPANSAFQAVDADQLKVLMGDTAKLTAVLTHHVVAGRRTPDRLTGPLTTLDNDKVTVTGSGAGLTISGDQTLSGQPAHLVCGNVQTANATVYVIDQVLKPQNFGG